jgi:hypothetical protein
MSNIEIVPQWQYNNMEAEGRVPYGAVAFNEDAEAQDTMSFESFVEGAVPSINWRGE